MILPAAVTECELKPLYHDCAGRLTVHHIINRRKTQGNRALREATEIPELLAWICLRHNSWTKRADTREARRFLLHKRGRKYGFDHMERLIASLPAKVPFTLDQLVGAMEWEPPRPAKA